MIKGMKHSHSLVAEPGICAYRRPIAGYAAMISLKRLLEVWGFTDHPFEAYTAEKEARLTDYFVSPPYLDDVLGTAETCAPVVVFGSRGMGKSAIRIHIENLCLAGNTADALGGRVVAVTHDDFAATLRDGLGGATLDRHLEALIQKMVCAALIRTARMLQGTALTREVVQTRLRDLDLDTFARLVRNYFINLSELQRETAARGVYDFVKGVAVSPTDRLNWFLRMWGTLRVPLLDVANLVQSIREKHRSRPLNRSPRNRSMPRRRRSVHSRILKVSRPWRRSLRSMRGTCSSTRSTSTNTRIVTRVRLRS